jgi:L-2-hydroxyglutarate oxidase LhgO
MESVEAVVVGAGVVGLAVAREIALQGHEVLVLEATQGIGNGTSSRNSEVIHAGIYYPQGSLKAQLCVQGRELLYAYCDSHGVGYRRCGKLIVATSEQQVGQLEQIRQMAAANGVGDLQLLSRAQALELEPALECVAA